MPIKYRYHLIGLFITQLLIYGQAPDTVWTKVYGDYEREWASAIYNTVDDGYILIGTTYSFGNGMNDVYIIKTDSNGTALWSKTYGTAQAEGARYGILTNNGGYLAVGVRSTGALSEDVYLLQTDSLGDSLWAKEFGGANQDEGFEVQPTSDGGYAIVGYTGSYGIGTEFGPNVYLIKTDSLGTLEWFKAIGDTTWEMGYSIQQCVDDGFIISGITNFFDNETSDVYVIRTDANGDTLWTRTYGGSDYEYGERIRRTSDLGYIIVGETASFGAGKYDVYAIKIDSIGDTIWTRTYGGVEDDVGMDVLELVDQGYVISGMTASYGAGGRDVYVIRIDLNGDTIWTKTIGGSGNEYGSSIVGSNESGYLIAGDTGSFGSGMQDVYLIKLAADTFGIRSEIDGQGNKQGHLMLQNPQHGIITADYYYSQLHNVEIDVYDIYGTRIHSESKKNVTQGKHSWSSKMFNGILSNGIYFIVFKIDNSSEVHKVILLK